MPRSSSRPASVWALVWALSSTVLCARPALADDDVADEADLHFRVGAERYTAGDYRGALEHFLASNRLVKNRNVVFNVARTYEKLERYPEAFRYFSAALAAETDKPTRERIEQSLDRIAPHVAVLEVETTPPGATLYVDRRDLGARGESPRALGLPEGSYRIIAELPRYHPVEAVVPFARAGTKTHVTLTLQPFLSTLSLSGEPAGARVFVDATTGEPRCTVPCELPIPPGPHTIQVTMPGYQTAETTTEVVMGTPTQVKVRLEPLKGTVVVTTDEPGALVEIDGVSSGFTPAVLPLPLGGHSLKISRRGYVSVERAVTVVSGKQVRVQVDLLRVEEVQAASRAAESVNDAPGSVTIIPREELTAFGYPTLADALHGVRGIYVWNDRSYQSIGIRGVGRLGSYTNRELVLLDGHPTNDDWVGSAYIGFDGRTDLADIERIEVVRGPGSVLYGTNAFSGVVNLVTRGVDPEKKARGEVGVSTADYGVTRGRVRAEARIGKDAGVWTSVALAHGSGRDFFFPELVDLSSTGGYSRGADGFDARTIEGRFYWKYFTVQWFANRHDKSLPTGEFDTLLSNAASRQVDSRAFIEARADPVLSDQVKLESRLHLNSYRYRGDFARAASDGGVEHDSYDGAWVGAEQRVIVTPNDRLRLTFGGEGQYHFLADQKARDDSGVFLQDTGKNARTYRVGAVYALADVEASARARLSLGVRLDAYSTFGTSLNPRATFIVRPYDRGNTKILAGKAFRAPSTYELYYNDGGITQVSSPDLSPESIYSFEIEHSHRFSSTWTGLLAVYANDITNLIVTRGNGSDTAPLHYVNAASPLVSVGGDVGVRREWRQGFMMQASAGVQMTRFVASGAAGDLLALKRDPTVRDVSNSPTLQASLKAAAPIVPRTLTIASRLTFEGARYDRYELVTEPAQGRTSAAVVWDVMLSGRSERLGLGYSLGVYNLADWRYSLPVSAEFTQRVIVQNGRTFLASLDVAF